MGLPCGARLFQIVFSDKDICRRNLDTERSTYTELNQWLPRILVLENLVQTRTSSLCCPSGLRRFPPRGEFGAAIATLCVVFGIFSTATADVVSHNGR